MLDFGLMARLSQDDMDAMVSSVVHIANRDYAALIDDFVSLKARRGAWLGRVNYLFVVHLMSDLSARFTTRHGVEC